MLRTLLNIALDTDQARFHIASKIEALAFSNPLPLGGDKLLDDRTPGVDRQSVPALGIPATGGSVKEASGGGIKRPLSPKKKKSKQKRASSSGSSSSSSDESSSSEDNSEDEKDRARPGKLQPSGSIGSVKCKSLASLATSEECPRPAVGDVPRGSSDSGPVVVKEEEKGQLQKESKHDVDKAVKAKEDLQVKSESSGGAEGGAGSTGVMKVKEDFDASGPQAMDVVDEVENKDGILPEGASGVRRLAGDTKSPDGIAPTKKEIKAAQKEDPSVSLEVAAGSAGELVQAWTQWMETNR